MRPSNFVFALLALALLLGGLLFSFVYDADLGFSRFSWPARQPDPPASVTTPRKAEPVFDKPTETTIYKTSKDPSRLSMDGDRQPWRPWLIVPESAPVVDTESVQKVGTWLLYIMGVLSLVIQFGVWLVNFGQWVRGAA
jgi:hypothetical protein